jgi:SAM-dependent methyltransferase
VTSPLPADAAYFTALQTETGWGRTLDSFATWCRPQAGWRTLDVGCGPGLLPALFAGRGCLALGVDLEAAMFAPRPLHPLVVQSDALCLPFPAATFHLATAVNLLFMLPDPVQAAAELARVVRTGGRVAVLNPSEHMSVVAAHTLADQHGLQGLARETLLNWASRAENHARWDERALHSLFSTCSLRLVESALRVGPGLARAAVAIKDAPSRLEDPPGG